MKKLLCMCLSLMLILSACGGVPEETTAPIETTAATEPPTETTQETTEPPITEFSLGELTFQVIEGTEIADLQEDVCTLTLVPDKAWASIYAIDVSAMEGSTLDAFVKLQHQSLADPDSEHSNESSTDVSVYGFDVTLDSYTTVSESGLTVYHYTGTFTDTWYAYTLYFMCTEDSEECSYPFGALIGSAVHSGKELREDALKLEIYPLNPDSTYASLAQEFPDHIYTTLGSENGLGGTIYKFNGTVEEYFTLDADTAVFDCAIVSTDKGKVLITNHYKGIYNATLLELGPDFTKAYYPYDVEDYTLPDVGEKATFICIYQGYSQLREMPAVALGANHSLFEILEFDDPTR